MSEAAAAVESRTVAETVTRIIADELFIADARVSPDARLDALGADSLDRVSIADAIGVELDVVVPDGDLEKIETVADLVAAVERRVAAINARRSA